MFYEASNNTFKAQEIYLEIIESTPEDHATLKRLISLYKNNNMVNDAIAMLNKYLEVNQVDEEAWNELCDMYLQRQNFSKAMYCFEELLSSNPLNFQYNIKYGEILYS
jgi:tetratricopeptide (TPR) repeat protein